MLTLSLSKTKIPGRHTSSRGWCHRTQQSLNRCIDRDRCVDCGHKLVEDEGRWAGDQPWFTLSTSQRLFSRSLILFYSFILDPPSRSSYSLTTLVPCYWATRAAPNYNRRHHWPHGKPHDLLLGGLYHRFDRSVRCRYSNHDENLNFWDLWETAANTV